MALDPKEIRELADRLRQRLRSWKERGPAMGANESPSATDLVELDAAAQRLEDAASQIEQQTASNLGDHFIFNLSHELRTPLTPVLLIVSSLQDNASLSDEIRADLATVREQIDLEARLVNNLLDATQLARGKLRLKTENVDLQPLLLGVVSSAQMLAGDQLHMSLDYHAGDGVVAADPVRLRQVFTNLLHNAVKFTPRGGKVDVVAFNPDQPGSPREVVVEVTDSGQGFDPKRIAEFFDPFGHSGENRRATSGLGLGLPIARGLVELHGGKLEAISAGRGSGAKFRVSLPLAVSQSPRSPQASPPVKVAAATKTLSPGIGSGPGAKAGSPVRRGLRVLLVEDHKQSRNATARLLGTLGYTVRTAEGYADALVRLHGEPFDLLISDIELPDGTGWNLMKAARQNKQIPGLALSGYDSEEDLRKSREAGFDAHLVKPITLQGLTNAIEAAIVSKPVSVGAGE